MYLKYFFRVIKYLYFKYFKKVFYTTLVALTFERYLAVGPFLAQGSLQRMEGGRHLRVRLGFRCPILPATGACDVRNKRQWKVQRADALLQSSHPASHQNRSSSRHLRATAGLLAVFLLQNGASFARLQVCAQR